MRPHPRNVVTAILGGGQGTRLWPLTRERAKPAVPVAGKFRLIDIPISNSLHAGIDRIFVLTQFNSASLHRHIAQTYRFDVFSQGFVNILAAEQSLDNRDWYQGTADAVRQNLRRLLETEPSEVLILSGDQLYLMAIGDFVERHRESDADLTVAVKPVPASEASALGIMRIDDSGRIVEFVEKPKSPELVSHLALDEAAAGRLGPGAEPGMLLASMGIYVFRPEVLAELLDGTTATDFGKEIIPASLSGYNVSSFVHAGYWRDIGTISAFHSANLELTDTVPDLDLYSAGRPVYTHPRFLPGCKVNGAQVSRSILCDGAIVNGGQIDRSIVGVRSRVQEDVVLDEVVMMGASHFDTPTERGDKPALGIGAGSVVRRAIIDVDARIGPGSKLVNAEGREEADGEGWCIRDGVVVVYRGATLPPGTVV
jgi:glucose-1-phosphate adenylyltransferase